MHFGSKIRSLYEAFWRPKGKRLGFNLLGHVLKCFWKDSFAVGKQRWSAPSQDWISDTAYGKTLLKGSLPGPGVTKVEVSMSFRSPRTAAAQSETWALLLPTCKGRRTASQKQRKRIPETWTYFGSKHRNTLPFRLPSGCGFRAPRIMGRHCNLKTIRHDQG